MKLLNWMLFLVIALIVPFALANAGHENWAIVVSSAVVIAVLWRMFGPAIELEVHRKTVGMDGKVTTTSVRRYHFNGED